MNDYDKYIILMGLTITVLLVIVFLVTIYGLLTGKISTESIDVDSIWFWLFLLK